MENDHHNPDVTDEELGMRTFQVKKARAVERAMERMRKGLKDEWSQFTMQELEAVSWLLGEVWAYVAHVDWEDLHFSTLTITDIRRMLGFAREITHHSRPSVDVLQDVYQMIVAHG